MTTEAEQNTNTTAAEVDLQVDIAAIPKSTAGNTTDKASAALSEFLLKGWTMLNDGCPDCNTPLMRNRDMTSQICVNCQLNPGSESPQLTQPAQATQPLPPPPNMPAFPSPPPTAALPVPPPRPASPQNHRVSVLDPMMEARKGLRPIGNRGSIPAPPTAPPPPRSSIKINSGPSTGKPTVPRPAGPPPSMPLSPPPGMSPPPQPTLRDMRRSPQSSMILSGNILPPSTPLPPPPITAIISGLLPSLPPFAPERSEEGANIVTEEQGQSPSTQTSEASVIAVKDMKPEPSRPSSQIIHVPASEFTGKQSIAQETAEEPAQASTRGSESTSVTLPEAAQEPVLGSPQTAASKHSSIISDDQPHQNTLTVEDEDDKAVESDDDFEDAEEEMSKPTEEEIKEREIKREQSERASRLIAPKMLQGWAMLQDPCPNPSCHGVPLLRSREKKEYCVICENYFQREQDLEHGKYTIVSANSNPTVSAAPTTAQGQPGATSSQLMMPENFPPPPRAPSPANPLHISSPAIHPQLHSPRLKSGSSPICSPSLGRNQRELLGRVSSPIVLPPTTTPNLGMASPSQHVFGKHMSEDLDRLGSEDEDTRRHLHMICKVGEYSSKSLPPVPIAPIAPRPISTCSNSSDGDKPEAKHHRHQPNRHGNTNGSAVQHEGNTSAPPPPPPPEIQALVAVTYKTIATILVKLEACRLALEVSDNPKECQVLTNQIKGLMECLKACREAL